ncbi:MAG TPA: hypothetical protein VI729_08495 [Anaerolineales bacterium]|nr:hypothetical protein [Anaerolineales bacterium]
MMDLIQRLAEIRELQGKEPLPDPTVIEGFPVGPFPPEIVQTEEPEDFYEPSPLVPRPAPDARADAQAQPERPAPNISFRLLIADREAAYEGHAVTLSVAEYASIVETVINAVKRVLQERLVEVQSKRWEEMRAAGDPDTGQSRQAPTVIAPPKRKRGRPRKEANAKTP